MRRPNRFARLKGGFALIDVLVALLISTIALLSVLGGIGLSARTARTARQRFLQIVEARNQDASEQQLLFIQEILPK